MLPFLRTSESGSGGGTVHVGSSPEWSLLESSAAPGGAPKGKPVFSATARGCCDWKQLRYGPNMDRITQTRSEGPHDCGHQMTSLSKPMQIYQSNVWSTLKFKPPGCDRTGHNSPSPPPSCLGACHNGGEVVIEGGRGAQYFVTSKMAPKFFNALARFFSTSLATPGSCRTCMRPKSSVGWPT